MAKVKIVLNRSGVRALLRSDESEAFCQALAQKAADSLGEGYEVSSYKGKNRVNASVRAETYQAKSDNLKNNTILKAVCAK
jgi:hypothetical protein